ncbi:hypothetical protein SALWKB12_1936 [Snodgrassella communis]|uniref:Uncharacterized protein n=1 Tax=Snodgrassella communis TaxID=2946699 RepID=A0A836MNT8_9NEIS|nr:hypothetical protein SALWKB12_1936 [Snodgrassella communis]KDN14251.1 hypothetical protein SALWKB29_1741 [Snodgrassella communis]
MVLAVMTILNNNYLTSLGVSDSAEYRKESFSLAGAGFSFNGSIQCHNREKRE